MVQTRFCNLDFWFVFPSRIRRQSTGYTVVDAHSWTVLPRDQRSRLEQAVVAREQLAQLRILNIDYYPRESHLITFRDPWSFPMLFHPACNQLVRKHMDDLAEKVKPSFWRGVAIES